MGLEVLGAVRKMQSDNSVDSREHSEKKTPGPVSSGPFRIEEKERW